jgi:hypothetical protein
MTLLSGSMPLTHVLIVLRPAQATAARMPSTRPLGSPLLPHPDYLPVLSAHLSNKRGTTSWQEPCTFG